MMVIRPVNKGGHASSTLPKLLTFHPDKVYGRGKSFRIYTGGIQE